MDVFAIHDQAIGRYQQYVRSFLSMAADVVRNHPLVERLAEHLLDLSFHPNGTEQPVARCGVVRNGQMTRRTAISLLRVRYLQRDGATPLLAPRKR